MTLTTELLIKAAASAVAALGVVYFACRPSQGGPSRGLSRGRAGIMLGCALLSLVVYYNGFTFHGKRYVHRWEMFHYALGAKYFEELGYDGIYAASLAAQRETSPSSPLPRRIRDIRSGELVQPRAIFDHAELVRARFEEARWREFAADNQHFLDVCPRSYLTSIRSDHGFNATPAWIGAARPILAHVSIDSRGLGLLGALDPLLLALAILALYRAFGVATASAAVVIFGLGFLHRFTWIGGAFSRLDWLIALLFAAAAFERRRHALAGALLGVSAALRVFPVLFLLGPLIATLTANDGSPDAPARGGFARSPFARTSLGVLGGVAAMFALGALSGRGLGAWGEFVAHIRAHAAGWLTNNVGLTPSVVHVFHLSQQPLDEWGTLMSSADWRRRLAELRELAPWIAPLAALPFIALVGVASIRAKPSAALAYGLASVFALTQPTCYYWAMLMLVPLAGGAWPTVAVLALGAALHLIFALTEGTGMSTSVYGVASWALAVFFVAWLAPRARAALASRASRAASPAQAASQSESSAHSRVTAR